MCSGAAPADDGHSGSERRAASRTARAEAGVSRGELPPGPATACGLVPCTLATRRDGATA